MSNKVVTILKVEVQSKPRKDGKGTYTLYRVQADDGVWRSTFDGKLGAFLKGKEGQRVSLEIEENERGYEDIKAAGEPPAEQGSQAAPIGRDHSIARQVALKAAVEITIARGGADDGRILVLADRFAAWIEEREPAYESSIYQSTEPPL